MPANARPASRAHSPPPRKRVAFAMSDLKGGGVQLVANVMADELLRRGTDVDFIVDAASGDARSQVPGQVRLVEKPKGSKTRARLTLLRRMPVTALRLLQPILRARRPTMTLYQLAGYIDYLATDPPHALMTTTPDRTIQAVWAAAITGAPTRIIATERVTPSYVRQAQASRSKNADYWQRRARLVAAHYPRAHAIVAVSDDLGRDLAKTSALDTTTIQTIYNPVVAPNVDELAAAPAPHAWLAPGQPPLILGAGRLVPEKDFASLIDAFAIVAAQRTARLMIIGEGAQRAALERRIASLGLGDRAVLPGWYHNPYAAMSRASVLALSSISEGLPGCLIQAIAVGCPAVATDCPNGPREILDNGRLGPLVPVRDPAALARAILDTLDTPPAPADLRKRGADFTVAGIVDQYENLMFSPAKNP